MTDVSEPAPYGSWPSPLDAHVLVAASVGLGGPVVDGTDVWWSELRPTEGGRVQLVRRNADGTLHEALPPGVSARSRVHEYGGGAWTVVDGAAVHVDWATQRVMLQAAGASPVALTPESPAAGEHRYADLRRIPGMPWLACVRERHDTGGEAVNELVAVRLPAAGAAGEAGVPGEPGEVMVLWSGSDFVSSPRPSADGAHLAWISWDHPRMPWDGTTLWVAELHAADGVPRLVDPAAVLGGDDESVVQPLWDPDGRLCAASDADGWWNVWRFASPGRPEAGDATPLTRVEGEVAQPHWVFGQSGYGFLADGTLVGSWRFDGIDHLGVAGPESSAGGQPAWVETGFTSFDGLQPWGDDRVVSIAASFTSEPAVVAVDRDGDVQVLRAPRDLGIDPSWWSTPTPIRFPSAHGRTARAMLYRPQSPTGHGPVGTAPPLLVVSHGGPTAAARPLLDLKVQYWTTRGWAVADVDYGGSTGYGRGYRQELDGAWGIVDVDDCEACARWLVAEGEADGERLAIKGSSAGGFTTLAALTFRDTFRAGSSLYGIGDLEALATDTHKFESRYLDRLLGPYPEARDTYRARSPIHHLDGLTCPVIVFQGLEDAVVPPAQAESIVDAVRSKGLPVAYLAFEGEQHGFRRAETILRVITAEQYFLSRVFGIEPADQLEPVRIENLA